MPAPSSADGDDERPLLAALDAAREQEQQERPTTLPMKCDSSSNGSGRCRVSRASRAVDRRRRAREQQHHSGVEHRGREQRRNEARQATAGGERQHPRATRTDELAADEQHRRHDQREHVVDHAERRERGEQRDHADARPDGGEHHRLEHTEPTRHMAEQPCELG